VTPFMRYRQHGGDESQILARPPVVTDDQRFQLVKPSLRRVLAAELKSTLEIVDDRKERAVDVIGRAMEAQTAGALLLQARAQLAQDTALADARLPGQHHHLAFAVLRQVPALHQQADFLFAANEAGQPTAANRFEAAPGNRYALDGPGLDRY